MTDVIDFAVDGDDLYLLYSDGHLTTCTFGFAGQPTKCTDPATFTDVRSGRESGTQIEGTDFKQIRFSPSPDTSLFLLDEAGSGVYHYSLRLTYQRQYRPLNPIDGVVTSFTTSPGRSIFLSFGNEVYGSLLP